MDEPHFQADTRASVTGFLLGSPSGSLSPNPHLRSLASPGQDPATIYSRQRPYMYIGFGYSQAVTTLPPPRRVGYQGGEILQGGMAAAHFLDDYHDRHRYQCPLGLKEDGSFPCPKGFDPAKVPVSKIISHVNVHVEPYQCSSCSYRACSSANLKRHWDSCRGGLLNTYDCIYGAFEQIMPQLMRNEWVFHVERLHSIKENRTFPQTERESKIAYRLEKYNQVFGIAEVLLSMPECTDAAYNHSTTKCKYFTSCTYPWHF